MAWLVKINAYGNVIWEKPIESGQYGSTCINATETLDGGFAIAGTFRGYGPKGAYRYISKTDSHGNCVDSITIIEE